MTIPHVLPRGEFSSMRYQLPALLEVADISLGEIPITA